MIIITIVIIIVVLIGIIDIIDILIIQTIIICDLVVYIYTHAHTHICVCICIYIYVYIQYRLPSRKLTSTLPDRDWKMSSINKTCYFQGLC